MGRLTPELPPLALRMGPVGGPPRIGSKSWLSEAPQLQQEELERRVAEPL
jgi:hypothetical protein